ncbi:uncharacterized protein PV07_08214 [Cladophialophora immunda]|uniref:Uncharacterized protein n=1 Tax=Cladophialophora immunda TaxID=569365 RepID=A0A0D2CEA4_9EURO|nr:uncharacterized protein PV07_08214 [Cladophialophora immunda]KIW28560.1 hypothetical protein PV07_08214 [Cladophialophora immunda]
MNTWESGVAVARREQLTLEKGHYDKLAANLSRSVQEQGTQRQVPRVQGSVSSPPSPFFRPLCSGCRPNVLYQMTLFPCSPDILESYPVHFLIANLHRQPG